MRLPFPFIALFPSFFPFTTRLPNMAIVNNANLFCAGENFQIYIKNESAKNAPGDLSSTTQAASGKSFWHRRYIIRNLCGGKWKGEKRFACAHATESRDLLAPLVLLSPPTPTQWGCARQVPYRTTNQSCTNATNFPLLSTDWDSYYTSRVLFFTVICCSDRMGGVA